MLATYFREVFLLCGGALMVCSQGLRRTARNLYTLPTCRANDLRAFTEQQDHIIVCSWLGRYGHLGTNRTSQRPQTSISKSFWKGGRLTLKNMVANKNKNILREEDHNKADRPQRKSFVLFAHILELR